MHSKIIPCGLAISAMIAVTGCKSPDTKTNIPEKPNIIYILADDLGWGDISYLGQEKFETPNIDQLIEQGLFFTNHYSGSTVCAPSRSSLLTGQHTGNTPVRGNKEYQPEGQEPLPAGTLTFAHILRDAGYTTGAYGKWGLGFVGTTGDPNKQGFDEFFGYNCQRYAHRYYPTHIWHNENKVILEGNDWTNQEVYAQDVIQDEALRFIERNKDNPFFLFVPSLIPHAELIVPDDSIFQYYKGKFPEVPFVNPRKGADYGPDLDVILYASQEYPRATFAAMIARLDLHVGQIVYKVKELGLEERTIIMFTSDNGTHREGGADPEFFNSRGGFRGYKRDLYEGGIRVPFVVSWPGVIEPGTKSDHISAFWDLLPTFSELAGAPVPEDIDGISFVPALLGRDDQPEHDYLYWEFHELGGRQAVRMGKWKGVKYNVLRSDRPMELYDLELDPAETNDLANMHPEIIDRMEEILVEARTESDIFTFKSETVRGE